MAQELSPVSGSPGSGDTSRSEPRFRFRIPAGTSPFSVLLIVLIAAASLIGTLLLGVYTWPEKEFKVFAVGALLAMAATGVASVAGFLFGLPRYSESGGPTASKINAEARAAGLYVPSNNLEQVSDWLTKLLIGAGLVQLGRVGRWLGDLTDQLARAFVSGDSEPIPSTAKVLAASFLALYSALGFLSGYIVTSIWYRRRLQEVLAEIEHRGGSS